MDTISRDNNSSYLPVAGVIVGLLALVLSAVALVKVSSANKLLAEHETKVVKIDGIESQLGSVGATSEKAAKDIVSLTRSTQDAITQIGQMIGDANAKIAKIEEGARRPAAKGGSKEPVVAGPDEYVIKGGDTFSKVGKAHGCSASDIAAVNPGVDSSHLRVGQKIKLPKK
ncbi:MAG: LysM peptidoglycan-binding domain-containing protein [Opitutaceae bacterium]|nr:LysM peptidoglycan-binding domain-containing protein [Opitutaceae bacterium]